MAMFIQTAGPPDPTYQWHVNQPSPIPSVGRAYQAVVYIQADGHELHWIYIHFPQYCGKSLRSPVQYFFGDQARQIASALRGNEQYDYDVVYADSTGA